MTFQPTSVTHSAMSRADRPYDDSSNSLSLTPPAIESYWMHAAPCVSAHFPILLLLSQPAEVTAVERFGNDVRVVESCEVSSQCFCVRNVVTGDVSYCFMHWCPILCIRTLKGPLSSVAPLRGASVGAWSRAPHDVR